MNYKQIIALAVLLALGLTSAYAGSDRRIGTAGAQELLIPVGSRGTAMGGAAVADPEGLESIYWNPAGLAELEGTEVMFSHNPYIADIDNNFGAVATNIEGFGTLAASAKVMSIGDIEETTEAQPEGTGSIYNPTLTVVGVTYARSLTAAVQFGATANFINENLFEVTASGVAFDFGIRYTPSWQGMQMGITIKNYGPNMKFSGSGFDRSYEAAGRRRVKLNPAPFELPSSVNLGVSYNFLTNGLNSATVLGNFQSNNHTADNFQGGFEYAYDNKYFLRAGYNYADQDEYLYGVTFGAGLSYYFGETKVMLEYAWTDTEIFDDNQYFTLRLGF